MRKDPLGRWVSKGLDLAATAEFGDIRIVWPPGAAIIGAETTAEVAAIAASAYDEQLDYVVALGSPTLIAVLAWAIGNRGKRLRMLEWDTRNKRYYSTISK